MIYVLIAFAAVGSYLVGWRAGLSQARSELVKLAMDHKK